MKKSLMFVAVAAAGMLASCSSDSLTAGSDPNIEPTLQDDLVPIEISVATPMARSGMTRGTGTVGGVVNGVGAAVNNDGTTAGAPANIWAGQKVNVYMFDKGTLSITKFKDTDPKGIFENAEIDTPIAEDDTNEGRGHYVDPDASGRYLEKYYPLKGEYDFWGYRIDDAATTAAAPTNNATNDTLQLNITVDGTQDVLGAKTVPAAWGDLDVTHQNQFAGEEEYNAYINPGTKLYSASSARKLVQPRLVFNHLMTRLTFEAYPGNDNAKTVYVTGIKVRPIKSIGTTDTTYVTNTGDLYIASKKNPFVQSINWGTAPGPLAAANQYQYELMERANVQDKTDYTVLAAGSWYSWNTDPTDNSKFIIKTAFDELPTGLGKSSYTVLAAASWYSNISDPTNNNLFIDATTYVGLPTGSPGQADYSPIAADKWYSLNTDPTDKSDFIAATAYAGLPDYGQDDYAAIAANSWYSLNASPTSRAKFIDAATYTVLPATDTADPDGNQNLVALNEVDMDITPSNNANFKRSIGEAIIAPDAHAYELEIDLKQSVAKYENSVPGTPAHWEDHPFQYSVVKTVASVENDFKPGYSYDFVIKVYGLEKIEVTTVLQPWIFGEAIDVVTE